MNTTLKNAVIRRIGGKETLKDVMNHGIDGGFPGFIYYSDTTAFYRRHRKAINEMAEEMANDMGENVLDMIAGFRCLNGFSTAEVGKVIYGTWEHTDEHTAIGNAMAWFAAEEVARDIWDR